MIEIATEAAVDSAKLDDAHNRILSTARDSYISEDRVQESMILGWERAVEHFFENGRLDEEEEAPLRQFLSRFGLGPDLVDVRGAFSRLVKGAVLRDVMNGVVPKRIEIEGSLPFNFQKTENLIWLFPGTEYLENKVRRHYQGGHHGVSLRVAKGVYYRVGAFKGAPVETTETVSFGKGAFAVTDRHLYFSGGKSFRVRHDKIVAIDPHSDGVTIHRDAQSALPQIFLTGDGWFTYNLLANISNL